jgi:hypothetical protein
VNDLEMSLGILVGIFAYAFAGGFIEMVVEWLKGK